MSKSLGNFLKSTFGFLIIFIIFACGCIINVLSYHASTVGLKRVSRSSAGNRRAKPLSYPSAFCFQGQIRQRVEIHESRSKQANDSVRMPLLLGSTSSGSQITAPAELVDKSKQSDVSFSQVQSIASVYDIHIHTKHQEVETSGDSLPSFGETWELFFQQHGTTTGHQSSQKNLNSADIVCSGKVSVVPSSSSTKTINNVHKKKVSIFVQCKAAHNDNDKMTPFAELCPFLVLNRLVNLVQQSGECDICNMNVKYVDWKDKDDSDDNIRSIDVEPSVTTSPTKSFFHSFLGLKEGEEKQFEMVDMVDTDGEALLSLPRQLVHQHNILHRGSGMLVMRLLQRDSIKKASPLTCIRDNPPSYWKDKIQLYCHRRTKTKRIFPSMYDMFVGGVSGTAESDRITAGRELAEELGLQRALEAATSKSKTATNVGSPLEGPIFRCTVQTSYNRCVVSVFIFTYNDELDRISWQEEEVDWGDFVSYEDVEASAMLSIQRLQDSGKWPGIPYEFTKNLDQTHALLDQRAHSEMKDWDYVPDGLLVWQAWEEWLKNESKIERKQT